MATIDLRFSPQITLGNSTRIGSETRNWGSKSLIVTDTVLEDTALEVQEQLDGMGIQSILFSRPGLKPTCDTVDEILSLMRSSYAMSVVAIGGVKIMSLGRLLAVLAPTGERADSVFDKLHIQSEGLPLLEIPGSGRHSLMFRSQGFLFDEATSRVSLVSYRKIPEHMIHINSSLHNRQASKSAAYSAASRLASAIESLLSPRSNFLSSLHARNSVDTSRELCSRVMDEAGDPDFSAIVSESLTMNALSSSQTGPGPAEILSWAVSFAAGTPGAATHAVLLPWFLESPFYSASPKLSELGSLFESEDVNPVEKIRALYGKMEIPGRLRELGAKLETLIPAADWASNMMGTSRVDLDESTFRDILELSC